MEALRALLQFVFRTSHSASTTSLPVQISAMTSSYSCTVSVESGTRPDDAQAHHVKDREGKLVSFKNPNPSFGIFNHLGFVQGLSMFIR